MIAPLRDGAVEQLGAFRQFLLNLQATRHAFALCDAKSLDAGHARALYSARHSVPSTYKTQVLTFCDASRLFLASR